MDAELIFGYKSDMGRERDNMEDALLIRTSQQDSGVKRRGALFIVADGVGGHKAGEVASNLAANTIAAKYYESQLPDAPSALSQAIIDANAAVFQQSRSIGNENMATTVVCGVIQHNCLTIGHVGDSRAYLLRAGKLVQLSQDHSWIHDQVARGVLTLEQAQASPYRNVINRSVGNKPQVEPEVHEHGELLKGDRLMFCTDGLYDGVSLEEMQFTLNKYPPQDACEVLVDLANKAGGSDNITVIVVEIQGQDEAEQSDTRERRQGTIPVSVDDDDPEHKIVHAHVQELGGVEPVQPVEQPGIPLPVSHQKPAVSPEQSVPAFQQSDELQKAIGSEPLPWDQTEKLEATEPLSEKLSTEEKATTGIQEWETVLSYNWPGFGAAMDKKKSILLPDGRKVIASLIIDEKDIRDDFAVRFGLSVEVDGKIIKQYLVGRSIAGVREIARDIERGDHHLLLGSGDLIQMLKPNPYIFVEIRDVEFAGTPEHKIKPGLAFMKLEVVFKIQLKS